MHSDFKELLSILNAERVKYLVVGGYAVSLYAQPRATKNLDILIKPDKAIAGIDFDQAWRSRAMETVDRKMGLKAAFISADELIAAKAAAGRAQDLADLEALHLARDRTARGTKPRSRSPEKRPAPKV